MVWTTYSVSSELQNELYWAFLAILDLEISLFYEACILNDCGRALICFASLKKGHVCLSKSICDKTTQYSLALKKYFGYQKFKTYPKKDKTQK